MWLIPCSRDQDDKKRCFQKQFQILLSEVFKQELFNVCHFSLLLIDPFIKFFFAGIHGFNWMASRIHQITFPCLVQSLDCIKNKEDRKVQIQKHLRNTSNYPEWLGLPQKFHFLKILEKNFINSNFSPEIILFLFNSWQMVLNISNEAGCSPWSWLRLVRFMMLCFQSKAFFNFPHYLKMSSFGTNSVSNINRGSKKKAIICGFSTLGVSIIIIWFEALWLKSVVTDCSSTISDYGFLHSFFNIFCVIESNLNLSIFMVPKKNSERVQNFVESWKNDN